MMRQAAQICGRKSAKWEVVFTLACQQPELKSRIDGEIEKDTFDTFKERTQKIANNFSNSRKVEFNNFPKRVKAIANAFLASGYGSFTESEISMSSPNIEAKNGL